MLMLNDYLQGVEYSLFEYWFHRDSINSFSVYHTSNNERVGTMMLNSDGDMPVMLFDSNDPENTNNKLDKIYEDFDRFKNRPEYLVGVVSDINSIEDLPAYYDKLLIGTRLVICKELDPIHDPDNVVTSVHRAIEWLRTTDFYTCPASTRYHENHEGGLVKHTLTVVNKISELHEVDTFKKNTSISKAVFIALVHDWCKIGLYDSYMRNVKDDSGRWVQRREYKYRDTSLTCFGHGVSSMFLVQKFFRLSLEEALAIRWHMNFCRVADSDMNELQQANENYPLVHMLQFADQLSIVKY